MSTLPHFESLVSGSQALKDPTVREQRARTIVVGASVVSTSTEKPAEHIVLISVDGTLGDALQVHGTYEGSLLASVDRRRLTNDLAVLILHRMYGEDVEISVGHMPSAVTP